MNLFSFSNIASAATGGLLIGLVAFGLHSCDVDKINAKHKTAMEEAKKQCDGEKLALQTQCKDDATLTGGISYDYQNIIAGGNADYADLLQRYQNNPIELFQSAPAGRGTDATDKQDQPRKASGITPAKYFGFANECETDRGKVIGLQETICALYYTRQQIEAGNPMCADHISNLKKKGLVK